MSNIANFFKNYGKVNSERLGDGVVSITAWLDAEGLSETAVKQKSDEHAEFVRQLVDEQAELKREKQEYDDIQALYVKKLAAAELAQADVTADPTNAAATAALVELLESVEKILPKLEKEKAEYESKQAFVDELQAAANEVAQELLKLRETINNTKSAQKEAELDLARATKAKEQAEKLAGLRSAGNKFDVALNALQAKADNTRKEAEAARITAEQLKRPTETVSSAATKYLDTVSAVPASTESLQDKLARLKAKS